MQPTGTISDKDYKSPPSKMDSKSSLSEMNCKSASSKKDYKNQAAETGIQRWLGQEIKALHTELQKLSSNFENEMTNRIMAWINRFINDIQTGTRGNDLKKTFEDYTKEIQNIIIDPYSDTSLDENAVIGSDGYVYSSYTHGIFSHGTSEEYKYRSIMNNQDPKPVKYRQYEPMKPIIQWLKKHHVTPLYPPSQNTLQLHEQLCKEGKISTASTVQATAAAAFTAAGVTSASAGSGSAAAPAPISIRDRRSEWLAEQARAREQEVEEEAQNEADFIMESPRHQADEAQDQSRENANRFAGRIITIENQFRQEYARVQEQIPQLNEGVNKLNADIAAHQVLLKSVETQVNQTKEQQDNLKQKIAELERKKEKLRKRRRRLRRIIRTVVVVGACVFGTWALCEGLKNVGLGGMVLPATGGKGGWLFIGGTFG
jgi:hypothetical protein